MADWGHELGLGLCQGIQTWSIRECDSIYRLDLPANEGEQLIHVALSPTSFVFNNLLQENQGADFQLPVHNVPFEMIQRAFHFY